MERDIFRVSLTINEMFALAEEKKQKKNKELIPEISPAEEKYPP
jgi:hypothetical protein